MEIFSFEAALFFACGVGLLLSSFVFLVLSACLKGAKIQTVCVSIMVISFFMAFVSLGIAGIKLVIDGDFVEGIILAMLSASVLIACVIALFGMTEKEMEAKTNQK